MNAFERMTDLSIAFICMFVVPYLFFQNAELTLEQQKAKSSANYFLECVQNSNAITEDMCKQLGNANYCAPGSVSYEVEVYRTEHLSDEYGGEMYVKYSWPEVLKLLESNRSLPLSEGDSVNVRIFGSSPWDAKVRLLTDLGRSI